MSRDILLSLIDPDPSQPRKTFDEGALDELAQSMAANGLAVPVLVRPGQDGRYLLVHGERRWRAAGRLGWQTIPAEVRDLDPDQARWLALVENIQRADLSPIDEARAYQTALSEGLTQTALGQKVGKSQSYIAQKLRLLTLPEPLQFYLDRLAISEGHARQLLRLRSFYGPDLQAGINRPLSDELLDPALWRQPGPTMQFLQGLRPLDGLYLMPGQTVPDLLADGCHAMASWLARGDEAPQWAIAAFWWASWVAVTGASVADLKQELDNAEGILYSAVAYLQGRDKAPADELGRLEYWGYRSDLRHSGCGGWAKEPPKDVLLAAAEYVGQNSSLAAPSSCQAYGPNGARYAKLVAKSDALIGGSADLDAALERLNGLGLGAFSATGWQVPEDLTLGQWRQVMQTLRQELDQAQTLPEVLAIRDQATTLQQEAAEFTLRNEGAAGQALLELQTLEDRIEARTQESALQIGQALLDVQGMLDPALFKRWLASYRLPEPDASYLMGCASGAETYSTKRAWRAMDKIDTDFHIETWPA